MNAHRWLQSTESLSQLDRPAGAVQDRLRRLLSRSRLDGLLRGDWLGHPVHPALVTVPIGAWSCSTVFDCIPGQQDTARRLIALGLAATPPAVLTGLADWSELDGPQRRVGVVHAAANLVASSCFLTSYRRRARGRVAAGKAWSLIGLLAVSAGGALGGHLSYALGAGVYRWQHGTEPTRSPGGRPLPPGNSGATR
ncbi:DUF2231 domain-containing protein [Pseudonocardia bannensis]|uniref:DUF2231 domain-containing protein n=1 Tax=Pseudonocardia bannensis TaxID=630973 RepID=A0A848DGX9_9PSEU|nr:DUF2231 domain-containing protein [Pseudonocardia bannensis]NMH91930.1 DUF2231 domain-containing protein [Pseudonocardia bannensis]